jgi:hypothetical protein
MPKQQFRNQKGGQRRKTITEFKKYLNQTSGGDTLELIAAYMATREGMKKKKERNEYFMDEKLKMIVESLKSQHNLAAPQQKRRWLSLIATLLPMAQLQKMGWKINSHSFRSARKHYEEYGPGAPIPKPQIPPKKQRIPELPEIVKQFFYKDEITRAAPNKNIYKKQVSIYFGI